jgi:phosphoribosylformylglycinamidine cyclo-ligase
MISGIKDWGSMAEDGKLTYDRAGVDYGLLDELKRFAQMAAKGTENNVPPGMSFVEESRGESAAVFDIGSYYLATTPEGLGTKNLIADAVDPAGETPFFRALAQDTVAMIVNDLIVVGARPLMVNAHWAFGGSQMLEQRPQIGKDLVSGWVAACNEAGAVYAAGETPILQGIIYPETMELSGSGVGIIDPKSRLVLGQKLTHGDHIVLIESSGIHANGLSLVRKLAVERLPVGYETELPSGKTLAEALLTPTFIYARLQEEAFKRCVDIHYMAHITGHGWRKLMRADQEFTYRFRMVPPVQEEFSVIQEASGLSAKGMYETFNMGAGFAFFVGGVDAPRVMEEAKALGFQSWDAGVVEAGEKQVIIEPKNIIYQAETLNIR